MNGRCVRYDPCDKTKIGLCSKGRFVVHFSVNVCSKANCKSDAAISLQLINNHQRTDINTIHAQVPANTTVTMSMGGIVIENSNYNMPSTLLFKLVSSNSLMVESSMLSIIEI